MIGPGDLAGSYRVVSLLGEGGMGRVYLAEHVKLPRKAALKVLRPEVALRPDTVRRFFNEAVAANRIGNEHIVEIYDYGTLENGDNYYVMELLVGESLQACIQREGKLSLERALHIATQISEALSGSHEASIVHRDLKPENIFLIKRANDANYVKVLDFGIAKLTMEGTTTTQTGTTLGTPSYMSPEQWRGEEKIDHRADIYSLGVLIHQLLTGHLPFKASSAPALMYAHLSVPVPSARALVPDLPEGVDDFLARAMAKDREERWPSMSALRDGLATLYQAPPGPVSGQGNPSGAGTRPRSSHTQNIGPGDQVGNYRVISRLGQGGMGVVFLAEQAPLKRRVALKVLRPELSSRKETVTRFFNEAIAANRIGHEHIIEVTDYGTADSGENYFVMELLSGESLGARLRAQGRLPIEGALHIATQVADALAASHAVNIVHRDLKPDNVFLIKRGKDSAYVKLLDFGIAKLLDDGDNPVTQTGVLLGTPHYMSPEQCRGKNQAIDARTDVYSLGVLLYQLLSGEVPFKSDSPTGVLVMHLTDPFPSLGALRPEVPERLEQAIARAVAKDREQRWPTMTAFKDELEALADPSVSRDGAATAARAAVAGPSTISLASGQLVAPVVGSKAGGASRALWALGGAIGLAVVLFVAFELMPRHEEAARPAKTGAEDTVKLSPAAAQAPAAAPDENAAAAAADAAATTAAAPAADAPTADGGAVAEAADAGGASAAPAPPPPQKVASKVKRGARKSSQTARPPSPPTVNPQSPANPAAATPAPPKSPKDIRYITK